jgi:hypothetical protein
MDKLDGPGQRLDDARQGVQRVDREDVDPQFVESQLAEGTKCLGDLLGASADRLVAARESAQWVDGVDVERALECRGVASDIGAGVVDLVHEDREPCEIRPTGRPPVPAVGVARGESQHLRALSRDDDRWTGRPRATQDQVRVTGGLVLSIQIRPTGAQQGVDDADRVLEAAVAPISRDPERLVVGGVAETDPEEEPPAADLVEGLRDLRGQPGGAIRRVHHRVPELDPRGRGGQGAEHRHRFPVADRIIGVRLKQRVLDDRQIEADRFGEQHLVTDVPPSWCPPFLPVECDDDADPHRPDFLLVIVESLGSDRRCPCYTAGKRRATAPPPAREGGRAG